MSYAIPRVGRKSFDELPQLLFHSLVRHGGLFIKHMVRTANCSIAYLEIRLIRVPVKKQMLPARYKKLTKTYCVKNIF